MSNAAAFVSFVIGAALARAVIVMIKTVMSEDCWERGASLAGAVVYAGIVGWGCFVLRAL